MQTNVTIPVKQYSYSEYREIVFGLAEKNSTTGLEQSTERVEATKLNAQRVKRLDKTININETLSSLIKEIDRKWKWTVLVESWCGDGAQNIPVIAKMAAINENIELKLILRDENSEIMNQYLTNGSQSIPILICSDVSTGTVIGTWGPRPIRIAEMVKEFKNSNPNVPHDEFVKNLHLWYAKDKGESIQIDFLQKINSWKNSTSSD